MRVITRQIEVEIPADSGMKDITSLIADLLQETGLEEGSVNVFVPGATGSISTVEYEPGLQEDVPDALEHLAPEDIDYKQHQTWNDDNGRSHVRATIMGPGVVFPFVNGKLELGTWQNIIAINHDTCRRKRKVVVQFMGV
ncbi:MAG: secondary thiamine-phosphate synthase enzyme YjbQ [Candidatus Bipolaricaulota bacterium]